jgi:hypothetical protein
MTSNNKDNNPLRLSIFQSMQEKDTEELLQIWKKNNRKEWSDQAFEVIHDILSEKLGTVPEQNLPSNVDVPETKEPVEDEIAEEDDAEEVFHDANVVLRIARLARISSWLVLVLGVALIILRLLSDLDNIRQGLSAFPGQAMYALIYGIVANAITWGVNFIFLQAISQALYIFLDIERNTYLANQDED